MLDAWCGQEFNTPRRSSNTNSLPSRSGDRRRGHILKFSLRPVLRSKPEKTSQEKLYTNTSHDTVVKILDKILVNQI